MDVYNPQLMKQMAEQRMAELHARAGDPLVPGLASVRRRVARTLRRLADWVEPALRGTMSVRIPAPRHPG